MYMYYQRESHNYVTSFGPGNPCAYFKYLTRFLCYNKYIYLYKKTLRDCKTLPRIHLISCQGVKLFLTKYFWKFCQKFSCQELSFWVLIHLDFSHNFSFAFCHIFSFWAFSQGTAYAAKPDTNTVLNKQIKSASSYRNSL